MSSDDESDVLAVTASARNDHAVSAANGKRRGDPGGDPARARTLLRARLADGPKRGSEIEAEAEMLDIPVRSLIAAAERPGVRTRRGTWWLPG
jgi:hypothetical protein